LLKENADTQTVSLTQDVDSVYDNISKFIAKYNEIIDTINNKLSEKYDRNYLPLTDEQKEAMNEDDIKKWEEKAKTGLLRNDSILQNIVYRMRSAVYDSVAGISTALSEIGITTDTYVTKGKLIIDETKLKEAIRNNPDNVMNL
jgi:flagellar hook-associated protein 2